MIIFIYGNDSQRIRESRYKIISEYQKKHSSGLNLLDIDLSSKDGFLKFEDSLKTLSFFDEVKLVSLSNVFIDENVSEKALAILKEFNALSIKEVVLMVAQSGTDKELSKTNKELFEYLKKGKPVLEHSPRTGQDLITWVCSQAKVMGSNISQGTAAYLIMKARASLNNELIKLSAYRLGEEIKREDIDLIVRATIDSNIFEMIDACASERRIVATQMLKKEIDLGGSPHYILTMLAFQYRNLLFAKGIVDSKESPATLIRRADVKPFTLNKSKGIVRHKEIGSLVSAHNRLGEIDIETKTGLLDIEDALYDFVLRY